MRKLTPVFLSMLLMLSGCTSPVPHSSANLLSPFTLTVLDAGKGDAMLITTPAGSHYMIDTGKKQDISQILAGLSTKDVQVLSGIILTHGHKDHMGGLEGILQAYPVEEVYISAIDTVTYEDGEITQLLKGSQTSLNYLSVEDTLNLDGVKLTVLGPGSVDSANENNNALVMSLAYGDTTMLLMGDAERESEGALLSAGKLPRAQLLKLGHHGEDDATSEVLLRAVSPQYGIVTADEADENDAPDDNVLSRLETFGIDYIVTRNDFFACDYTSDGMNITKTLLAQPEIKTAANGILIEDIDRKAEYVRIKNTTDQEADLSGYRIFSENGGETYIFPKGTILAPGKTLTIVSGDREIPGDLVWTKDKVWKNKKADAAMLYDQNGTLIDTKE